MIDMIEKQKKIFSRYKVQFFVAQRSRAHGYEPSWWGVVTHNLSKGEGLIQIQLGPKSRALKWVDPTLCYNRLQKNIMLLSKLD